MFIIKFMGGIGNQLYQLNFYYYIKKRFPNAKVFVNFSYYKQDSIHGGYMLDGIRLPQKKHFIFSLYRLINDLNYIEDFSENDDILFEGYWQNTRFLSESFFSFFNIFKNNINKENQNLIDLINNSSNSVSIHVRCGDYDNHFCFGNISTKSYYNNAIEKICNEIDNPTFFIFSNNLDWTKANLNFKNSKTVFVTCNSKPEDAKWDLYLMSLCHYNIISNSSFSWWAQNFNSHTDKKVITPPYWTNQKTACFTESTPNIQQYSFMDTVSNLPAKISEHTNSFSIILVISDFEQGLMKLRRSISTIYNQNGNIPKVIIANPYEDLDIKSFINSYESLKNSILIYNIFNASSEQMITEICKTIDTEYFIALDSNSYFCSNVFSIIDQRILENKDFDIIDFSSKGYPSNSNITSFDKLFLYNKILKKEYILESSSSSNNREINSISISDYFTYINDIKKIDEKNDLKKSTILIRNIKKLLIHIIKTLRGIKQ